MPQVMPAEVLQPRLLDRSPPGLGVHLNDGSSPPDEHVALMLSQATTQDGESFLVERYADGLPRLGLLRMDPGHALFQVHLRPLKMRYVALPQSGREAETRHRSLVGRKAG